MERLSDYIQSHARIVIFTGAGISTDSGIPDFRSPTGLWQKLKPIMFQDFLASEEIRIEAWRRKFELDKTIDQARPNFGHSVIAKLIECGKASCVITQNIDNLHQDSGVPEEKIIELHGNGTYAKCLDCHKHFALEDVFAMFSASNGRKAPRCDDCGGFIKSATVSFGQQMPEIEMRKAESESRSADLFFVIGSSLQVFPAAGLPIIAKKNGARLLILNNEATELDAIADLVIHDDIAKTLKSIVM